MSAIGSLKKIAENIYLDGRRSCDDIGEHFLRTAPPLHTLLDVGCGSGDLTTRWARAARAAHVIGLEFVDSELEKARQNGIDARKADLSRTWPVASNECDCVISSQNIEHMHRTRFYFEEILRVLRPGGTAVILTENLSSWGNIAALMLGLQPFSSSLIDGLSIGNPYAVHSERITDSGALAQSGLDGIVGVDGHVRVLAHAALKDAAKKTGFQIGRYESAGYAPFWGAPSRLASRIDPCHAHFLAIEIKKPLN